MRALRRGLTLLELTIALLMAATLMGALGMILTNTVTARGHVEREARVRRMGPAILAVVTRDLRNAWATGPDERAGVEGSWFKGESRGSDGDASDEVWFVTSVDSFLRYEGISSDITEVGYYVKPNLAPPDSPLHGLKTLYRREQFSVDKRPDEGGLGVRVYDRVVSFRLRFYSLPRDALGDEGELDAAALEAIVERGGASEEESWDAKEQNRLPYAVRVELVLDVTPLDSFDRLRKPRYGVYEALVRLPSFPRLDSQEFSLFAVTAPTQQPPPQGQQPPPQGQQPPPQGQQPPPGGN
jgi:hypothetical protein